MSPRHSPVRVPTDRRATPSPSVARGDRDAGSFYAAASDGAVRPVDSSIDPLVWERLGHRADFQIVEWPR
jgi:hypothetical protein